MKLRILISALALLFAVYCATEAYQIARAGVVLSIPQLAGDGGGGLVYSLVEALAGLMILRFTRFALVTFLGATCIAIFVGLLYGDSALLTWAAFSLALAGMSGFVVYQVAHQTSATARQRAYRAAHATSRSKDTGKPVEPKQGAR